MDDAILASRAAAGDLDSLGQLYDRYFAAVYDFSWRTLRDQDAAAEATREAFVRLTRTLSPAAAAGFRARLFLAAHAAALARTHGADAGAAAAHEEAFGAFDAPDPCHLSDPAVAGDDPELPCLIWEGAASLAPSDYALLDLHVRQRLDQAELAAIFGVSRSNAASMTARFERAAHDAIRTYVVARRGDRDCAELTRVLAATAFPPYTQEVRHAVDEHIRTCDVCQRTARAAGAPLEVFAALSPVAAPFVLKGEIWRDLVGAATSAAAVPATAEAGESELPAWTGAGAAAAAAGLAGGGEQPPYVPVATGAAGEPAWQKPLLFAGAAVAILIVAVLGATVLASAFDDDGGGGATSSTETAQASATRSTPGVVFDTSTAGPSPSITSTPEETDTATAAPPTNTAVPVAPTATATRIVVTVIATPPPQLPTPTQRPPAIRFPTRTPTPLP